VSNSAPTRASAPANECGSILIEVVVAMVLVSLLIVSLASGVQSAADRAVALWAQAETIDSSGDASVGIGAWEWGATVATAGWAPGPTLEVCVGGTDGEGPVIGIWLNGWFLDEREPDDEGRVRVRASDLCDSVGAELVVRVREPGGTWGPPWRSVVPEGDGGTPADTPAPQATASDAVTAAEQRTVAHLPVLATPALAISWADEPVGGEVDGATLMLPASSTGSCAVTLEERSQSWWMEAGRALDVYF
jgi:hypothetical protein